MCLRDRFYTDVSCLKNPGNGGRASIICTRNEMKKISVSEKDTTNNRMELLATINALKEVNSEDLIEIYTDSKYVKNGITDWIHNWIKNNWKTSNKEDVKNKDLWVQLHELSNNSKIKWNWVKAHAGNPLNEEVDLLAKKAASLD